MPELSGAGLCFCKQLRNQTLTKKDFKHIYDQYGRAIRNYIYYRSGNTALADDITQESFIKLWEKRKRLSSENIKPLLYKIAGDKFVDFVRKSQYEADYIEEFKFRLKSDINADKNNAAILKKCERALKNLTEKERTVFLLSRKDELKYAEISERLGISIKAVEKRMSKALKKIRNPFE